LPPLIQSLPILKYILIALQNSAPPQPSPAGEGWGEEIFKYRISMYKHNHSKQDYPMSNKPPVKLFYSYAHEDEALRDKLDKHLAQLKRDKVIESWHDRDISAGRDWQNAIDANLEAADIILLLVSADFLASDYCFDVEIKCSMQRHQEKSAVVIPVLLRSCDTHGAEFMKLQGLPKDLKPVTTWDNLDEAFTDIAKGIRAVAKSIRGLGIQAVAEAIQNKGITRVVENTGKPDIFNVPVPRNPFFTGRVDILENLHQALHEQHEIALKPSERATALSGLGGVGKTQTAAEYAHRYKDDYSAVLWVLADGEDLLRSSFAQLSVLLGFQAEKQDDQILAVQSWLRNNDGWLLIFDNAETLALLTAAKELLPSNFNGHVLFTTRAQATGSLASVPVDCFDDDTGAVFLLRRSKWVDMALAALEQVRSSVSDSDWQTATTLVHELGGLALAIDQAGAYIEQTECGLEGYLTRYRNNAAAMLNERGYVQSADHPEAVYKTFLLALENAEKRHPLAGEILRDSALLHPDGISEKLYADCDPLDLDKALAALKDYSLIQRVPERKLFTVHRLVQVVVRDVCDG